MIQNDLLYSRKAVVYPANSGRRIHSNNDTTQTTDDNMHNTTAKFGIQIDNKFVSRILVKYFCDIQKLNFQFLTLETGTKNYLNQKKKSYKHWCT